MKLKEWMEPNSCHNARNLVNIKSFITVCFSVGLHTDKQMAHHLKKTWFLNQCTSSNSSFMVAFQPLSSLLKHVPAAQMNMGKMHLYKQPVK